MIRDRDIFNGDAIGCALGLSMTAVVALCIAAMCLLLGGCSTSRKIPAQRAEYKSDSVRVEVRERTVFVPDTVFVNVPLQEGSYTGRDTVNSLENDFAVSLVQKNSDGSYTHVLRTKPQQKPVKVERQISYRDSIVYRNRNRNVTVLKTVERKRTWWEQTQIYGCRILVALIALGLIIRYRKGLLAFIIRLCRLIR